MSNDAKTEAEALPRCQPRIVFVFGSNREGRHGKGAALEAMRKHGAKYGCHRGLHGSSYAIVTKELRSHFPPVTLEEIRKQVVVFLAFAAERPHWTFNVTPIGCGLAGFTPEQIAPMFAGCPANVVLPEVFTQALQEPSR